MHIEDLKKFTQEQFDNVLSTYPSIKAFHEGRLVNKRQYIRHIIEGINRIHYNNEVDALALLDAASKKENEVSKNLAQYLAEEISHDEIILEDLKKFDVDVEDVKSMELFFSTKLLIGFITFSIKKDGYIASVLWDWFVEWYSEIYNPTIVQAARRAFGQDKTVGIERHLQIDEQLNHSHFMDEMIHRFYQSEKDKTERYITNYITLIRMYFIELLEND